MNTFATTLLAAMDKGFASEAEDQQTVPLTLIQRWLAKYYVFVLPDIKHIGSDEWVYVYWIKYLPTKHLQEKRRCQYFVEIESYKEGFGTYTGAWNTPQEALLAGVTEALTLLP